MFSLNKKPIICLLCLIFEGFHRIFQRRRSPSVYPTQVGSAQRAQRAEGSCDHRRSDPSVKRRRSFILFRPLFHLKDETKTRISFSSRFRVHHEVLSSAASRGCSGAPPARPAAQAALAAHAQLGLRVLRDWERRRLQR